MVKWTLPILVLLLCALPAHATCVLTGPTIIAVQQDNYYTSDVWEAVIKVDGPNQFNTVDANGTPIGVQDYTCHSFATQPTCGARFSEQVAMQNTSTPYSNWAATQTLLTTGPHAGCYEMVWSNTNANVQVADSSNNPTMIPTWCVTDSPASPPACTSRGNEGNKMNITDSTGASTGDVVGANRCAETGRGAECVIP